MTLREKIIQLLEQGTPMLSMDIAKRLGVKKPSASKATKDLHNQGLLHIVEWDGGNKFYAAGSGKDAIKPDAIRAQAVRVLGVGRWCEPHGQALQCLAHLNILNIPTPSLPRLVSQSTQA